MAQNTFYVSLTDAYERVYKSCGTVSSVTSSDIEFKAPETRFKMKMRMRIIWSFSPTRQPSKAKSGNQEKMLIPANQGEDRIFIHFVYKM